MSKRIAILGATGSIGTGALEVIGALGEPYRAVAISGWGQAKKLLEQVRQYRPSSVGVADQTPSEVVAEIEKLGAKVYRGERGLVEIVERDDVDIVLAAIVGAAGLPAVLAAVKAGKRVALANKESLVVGGSLVISEAKKNRAEIIPVDSEHSAIFQSLLAGKRSEVKKVILTASGGPFRTATKDQMRKATADEALKHPTWRMGSKVTIDSATMFNKGLELIEACWLFDLKPKDVEIVIHPESVIHSMVEFVDGSVIAQLSPPDMRTPIQYALTYPERRPGISRTMDWTKAQKLHFEPPDFDRFEALGIAYEVAEKGGTLGAVMNAANEIAVGAFMAGNITLDGICSVVRRTIDAHRLQHAPSLDDLLDADRWARQEAKRLLDKNGV